MAKYATIDEYIDQALDFAQPILHEIRSCVREACPGVEETIKWSFPNFVYKKKILCSMAAFKKHASFSIWLGGQLEDPHGLFVQGDDSGMGQFGKLYSVNDLPKRAFLIDYLLEAQRLIDAGAVIRSTTKKPAKVLEMPAILFDTLENNLFEKSIFERFSQSHRNEYIEWISEAKTPATQQKRLTQMLEWLMEGKTRNWKYMK